MHVLDFHKIEYTARNQAGIFKDILKYIQTHSSEEAIRLLKLAGIGIKKYPSDNKIEQYQKISDIIGSYYGNDDEHFNQWKQDVSIINSLFDDLVMLREAQGFTKIPKNRQAVGFLIVLEIFLGSSKEYSKGQRLEQIKKSYPFVITMFDEKSKKLIPAKADYNRVLQVVDTVSENAGSILKYFLYEDTPVDFKNALKYEEIKILREHTSLYNIYSTLEDLEEKWRMLGLDITPSANMVTFSPPEEKPYQAIELSLARFQNQRTKWQLDFQNEDKSELIKKLRQDNNLLPTEGFISEEEGMHSISLAEFLHTEDLRVKLKDVELREWLRAYSVIIREMEEVIKKRLESKRMPPMQLNSWCDVRPISIWLNLFISAGITEASAQIIIESLIFTKKSKDLLDCPFIMIPPKKEKQEPEVCVIPSLAAIIDPALSIISNLSRSTSDIAMKGTGLENDTIELLREAGINVSQIEKRDNGDTYECDAFFVLNDHLIFIECKAFGQPSGVRDYYQLMQNIVPPNEEIYPRAETDRSATEQLNRIADYYLGNISLLREKLGLSETWTPTSVIRIVLTTAMLGESVFSNGCFIVDDSIFSRFIKRDMPYISIGPYRIRTGDENYNGDITIEKLINILSAPPQINIIKRGSILNYNEINIFSKKIRFHYYSVPAGKFQILDESNIILLIEKGVLPEDALEQIKAARTR